MTLFELGLGIISGGIVLPLGMYLGKKGLPIAVKDTPKVTQDFWVFTDENGKSTGERIPANMDPHEATQEKSLREGKSFGAKRVRGILR